MIVRAFKTLVTNNVIAEASGLVCGFNMDRRGIIVYNNSSNSVYLTFGPIATSSTCSLILATFASWQMLGPVIWCGPISAIRNAGTGNVLVTELYDDH